MKVSSTTFIGHIADSPFFADELFRDLDPQSSESLRKIRRRKFFRKNDTILSAGDLPTCLYILNSGQARLTVSNGINDSRDRRLIGTDEILGLNELISNSFCSMEVEALTPCVFECLKRCDFLEFLGHEPAVCFRLLNCLGQRVQRSYEDFSKARFR